MKRENSKKCINDLSKICNPKKRFSNFLSPTKTILISLATTIATVPLLSAIPSITMNANSVEVNGKWYSSANSAIDDLINTNQIVKSSVESDQSYWTLLESQNGENNLLKFENSSQLREYVYDKYLQEKNYYSSATFEINEDLGIGDLSLDPSIFGTRLLSEEQYNAQNSTQKIYQGVYDTIENTESKVKIDYFKPLGSYYFNGLYFNSRELLHRYLVQEYLPTYVKSGVNTIVLIAPDGTLSNSINLAETNGNNAMRYIDSFITTNAEVVVEYFDKSQEKNITITQSNKNAYLDRIDIKDFEYQKMYSNSGDTNTIIDLNVSDLGNLYGPYVYNGSLDISSFTNKSMWTKSHSFNGQVYQDSMVDTLIGTFFGMSTGDDQNYILNESKNGYIPFKLFTTGLKAPIGSSETYLDVWYLDYLGRIDLKLRREVESMAKNLMSGKKFNLFSKIPIFYSYIMNRLINAGVNQNAIRSTIYYFKSVADYYQDCFETTMMFPELLINEKGEKFNLASFFEIGNPNFDLNTPFNYFLEKIKEWPLFVTAMFSYINAINNLNYFAGKASFESFNPQYLIDFGIISTYTFNLHKDKFKSIFDTFSKSSYYELVNNYVRLSNIPEVKKIRDSFSEGLWVTEYDKLIAPNSKTPYSQIIKMNGVKNGQIAETLNLILNIEVYEFAKKDFNKSKIVTDGFLSGIAHPVEFSKWVIQNNKLAVDQQLDPYMVYLTAYNQKLNEYKNLNNFLVNDPSIYADQERMAHQVIRAIESMLATPFLLSMFIKDIYATTSIANSFYYKSMFFRAKKSLMSYGVEQFDVETNLPEILEGNRKRRWVLENHEVILSKNYASSKFMRYVNTFVNVFFDIAMPILSYAFFAVEIIFMAISLFTPQTMTDFYTYTTIDGQQFVWDGGRSTSTFFGSSNRVDVGIDSMKINIPIEINLANFEDYYYYDSIKYYDEREIKISQINNLLNPNYAFINNKFKRKFTFDATKNGSEVLFDDVNQLAKYVKDKIGISQPIPGQSINVSKLDKSSPYLSSSSFAFDNGIITDSTNTIDAIATNITSNIRETFFVKKPKITNGFADGIDNSTRDLIPGIVWNGDGQTVDNTSELPKYLIDNSANALKTESTNLPINGIIKPSDFVYENRVEAETKAKEKLFANFEKSFNVRSKIAINGEVLSNDRYSSILDNVTSFKIYEVNVPGYQTKYFKNRYRAENFILKNVNVEKVKIIEDVYYWNGLDNNNKVERLSYSQLVEKIKGLKK